MHCRLFYVTVTLTICIFIGKLRGIYNISLSPLKSKLIYPVIVSCSRSCCYARRWTVRGKFFMAAKSWIRAALRNGGHVPFHLQRQMVATRRRDCITLPRQLLTWEDW